MKSVLRKFSFLAVVVTLQQAHASDITSEVQENQKVAVLSEPAGPVMAEESRTVAPAFGEENVFEKVRLPKHIIKRLNDELALGNTSPVEILAKQLPGIMKTARPEDKDPIPNADSHTLIEMAKALLDGVSIADVYLAKGHKIVWGDMFMAQSIEMAVNLMEVPDEVYGAGPSGVKEDSLPRNNPGLLTKFANQRHFKNGELMSSDREIFDMTPEKIALNYQIFLLFASLESEKFSNSLLSLENGFALASVPRGHNFHLVGDYLFPLQLEYLPYSLPPKAANGEKFEGGHE